ncbi:dna rna polymerases superfamily protein [Cystoisospora suis]|uniref:Dna rna polymerases superfamily protein n=1 Tax=Cystoisospora suis TaxID=483139 RepID=A0A2C6KKK5_9APIC|nr:dna rna polymerases superfamily protein [Cystoisospora suis]
MDRYVREYVMTYVKCQQNKRRCAKPSGLLQPLPVADCPWPSIAMDFIIGLPPSGDSFYDSICVVVDRLMKMAHFFPWHTTTSPGAVC